MAKNDGGPAFPRPVSALTEADAVAGISSDAQEGMALRDFFAVHAPPPPKWWLSEYRSCFEAAENLAVAAEHYVRWNYEFADAMLRERAKQE